jgi:hypothetical protein
MIEKSVHCKIALINRQRASSGQARSKVWVGAENTKIFVRMADNKLKNDYLENRQNAMRKGSM